MPRMKILNSVEREVFDFPLQAMAHGSAAAWGHLNLLGEYFSEDKLQDSVGIKLPKLAD
jgi:hypothetical protein